MRMALFYTDMIASAAFRKEEYEILITENQWPLLDRTQQMKV